MCVCAGGGRVHVCVEGVRVRERVCVGGGERVELHPPLYQLIMVLEERCGAQRSLHRVGVWLCL